MHLDISHSHLVASLERYPFISSRIHTSSVRVVSLWDLRSPSVKIARSAPSSSQTETRPKFPLSHSSSIPATPRLLPLSSFPPASVPLSNAITLLTWHSMSQPTLQTDASPQSTPSISRTRTSRRRRNGLTVITASGQVTLCSDESADEESDGKTHRVIRGINARAELRKQLKRRSWKHNPQNDAERHLSKQHRLARAALKQARVILAEKKSQRLKSQETLQLWRRAMPIAPGCGPSSKAHEMCLKEMEDTHIAIEFLQAHIDTLQVAITKFPELLVLLKLEDRHTSR